ncbi:MAG: DUF5009 domain-containing protein [Legionellaceae bacterium]|nr:DUF5009 domain-containing protein [Legionellaceae bacterium]MBP9775535.1 DUF5009 domain-containing protein [Legionellaceae bacterium]
MPTQPKRLLSLDVFRGITIAGMILVNTIVLSPFQILDHAEWNGCTFADLVFPFFLVVMGISLVLSISKQRSVGISQSHIFYKIIQRTFIIFLLGMLLNIFPYHMTSDTFMTVRVYGVLQRIALCYFFSALTYLYLNTVLQIVLTGALLIGYWMLMTYYPVPHYGFGNLSPAGNLGAYLDRLIFNPTNLYGKVFDPEGLLSTLPAIASTLFGNIVGIGLLTSKTATQKFLGMLAAGTFLMALGWFWGQWFPINKALWTSSYALWTAGLALLSFAICYGLIEIKHIVHWSKPFEIFGLNAIVAYFLHVLFFKIQLKIHLSCGWGKTCNLRQIILKDLFGWMTLPYASLTYAITSVLFWLLVLTILYKRKIFIRV